MAGPISTPKPRAATPRPSATKPTPSAKPNATTAPSRSTPPSRDTARSSTVGTSSSPADSYSKSKEESPSANPEKFQSFLGRVQEGFGQLQSGSKPLEFSEEERQSGQQAADTLERFAGQDKTWSKDDLANNLAQLQTPSGIKGSVMRRVAQSGLFKAHNVPEGEQSGILKDSQRIREENPNIAKLHKLEGMDPEKISDPAQRAKYDEMKTQLTSELGEKGLLPVGIDELKQMGSSSDLLKEKLQGAGLPLSEGQPVKVDQYRGLFEGKSPIRTQLGF